MPLTKLFKLVKFSLLPKKVNENVHKKYSNKLNILIIFLLIIVILIFLEYIRGNFQVLLLISRMVFTLSGSESMRHET